MAHIEDALLRMVQTARKAKLISDELAKIGSDTANYDEIYGKTADAIYYLIGEKTETFDESVTQLVLDAPYLSDERRVKILMSVYREHMWDGMIEKQPVPHLMSEEEFNRMYKENGGYKLP